mmetsp:Transcript_64009/g.139177  ORF Transcript_64009/g.139177 Transcript_64009/m.139177 type:complete len:216 (+) Transcript_64009:128-775(+)
MPRARSAKDPVSILMDFGLIKILRTGPTLGQTIFYLFIVAGAWIALRRRQSRLKVRYTTHTTCAGDKVVTIEYPGVKLLKVKLETLFNGAYVCITRDPTPVAPGGVWERTFQYPVQEGHFELEEDESRLEHDQILLLFRPRFTQPKVVRLISTVEKYDMTGGDSDEDTFPAASSGEAMLRPGFRPGMAVETEFDPGTRRSSWVTAMTPQSMWWRK